MKNIIFLLLFLFVFPTVSFALSEAEHLYFLKNYPEYKKADKALNKYWKKFFTPLIGEKRKEVLESQREWVKSNRDTLANEFMDVGLSRPEAYIRTTFRRINELRYLEYNLSRDYASTKPLDYFLDDTDYPSYYAKSPRKTNNSSVQQSNEDYHTKKIPQIDDSDIEDEDDIVVNYKKSHTQSENSRPNISSDITQKDYEPIETHYDTNPVAKLNAGDAILELNQNSLRFDNKYKNKTINITGFIQDIQEENNLYVISVSGSVNNFSEYVVCYFTEEYKDAILTLNKEESVSVIGLYKGVDKNDKSMVKIYNCKIEM